jgi:hypothetical protein
MAIILRKYPLLARACGSCLSKKELVAHWQNRQIDKSEK